MSRILQALKQLENRPVTEPIPPATPPAATSPPEIPNARLPTMPFVPGAQRKLTERVKPRRQKKRKAQRIATAEQVEQLLAAAGPGVIECWSSSNAEQQILAEGSDPKNLSQTPAGVVVISQLPAVITVREPQAPPVDLRSEVRDCWSAGEQHSSLVMESLDATSFDRLAPAVTASGYAPQIVTVKETAPDAAPLVKLDLAPSVIEHWLPLSPISSVVFQQSSMAEPSAPSVTASGYAPQIITVREPHEGSLTSATELLHTLDVIETSSIVEPTYRLIVEDARVISEGVLTTAILTHDQVPQVMVIREHHESETPTVSFPLHDIAAEARALQMVEDLRSLLASMAPTVVESWSPDAVPQPVVVDDAGYANTDHSSSVLASDYAPTVITIREPARAPEQAREPELSREPAPRRERMVTEPIPRRSYDDSPPPVALSADEVRSLLGDVSPSVVECWSEQASGSAVMVADAHLDHLDQLDALTAVVLAADGLPEALTTEASSVPATEPEVDLQFRPHAPRRRENRRVVSGVAPGRERRNTAQPDRRELEMRKLVRGNRSQRTAAPSTWETEITTRLQQAAHAAPYRQLVSRWQTERRDHNLSTLLVVSLGAPHTAAEVALSAAHLLIETPDMEVLIVDADDGGSLSRQFGLAGKSGLTDLLSPQDAHGDVIYPTGQARVSVLPLGRGSSSLSGQGQALDALLADLAQEYAWIIVAGGRIDSSLTQALARTCRGTYLIAPLGEVDASAARRSVDTLRTAGARVLGSMVVEFGS